MCTHHVSVCGIGCSGIIPFSFPHAMHLVESHVAYMSQYIKGWHVLGLCNFEEKLTLDKLDFPAPFGRARENVLKFSCL